MILPMSATAYSLRCRALSTGTSRLSAGATAQTTIRASRKAPQPAPDSNGAGGGRVNDEEVREELVMIMVMECAPGSGFGGAALHREDALRALLDEDDDEHQHRDLGQHGPGDAFEEFVQDAQAQRGIHRAGQLPHPAQH